MQIDREPTPGLEQATPFITSEISRPGGPWRRVAESGCEQGEPSRAATDFGLAPSPVLKCLGTDRAPRAPAPLR
jgi:hypothetical protein